MSYEHVSDEQLRYAAWLDVGTKVGLVLLVATFALYATGIVPPHIPLSDLPAFWVLPVNEYLAAAALQLDVPLVTHNSSDYRAVDKLTIVTAGGVP